MHKTNKCPSSNLICICPVYLPIQQQVTTLLGPHLTLCCLEIWLDTCLHEPTSWRWGQLCCGELRFVIFQRETASTADSHASTMWNRFHSTGVRQLCRVGFKGHRLCGRWLGHPPRWGPYFSDVLQLLKGILCEWWLVWNFLFCFSSQAVRRRYLSLKIKGEAEEEKVGPL